MPIKDDHNQQSYRAQAVNAMNNADELLAQRATDQAAITALKVTVVADVALDVWTLGDFQNLTNLMTREASNATRQAVLRTELIALQTLITSVPYKAEIQDVIDLL